jgi:hypothetical protein
VVLTDVGIVNDMRTTSDGGPSKRNVPPFSGGTRALFYGGHTGCQPRIAASMSHLIEQKADFSVWLTESMWM